jgi:hypothetical protein
MSDIDTKMIEFHDLNTFIAEYHKKLGCGVDPDSKQTVVDRLFGISRA